MEQQVSFWTQKRTIISLALSMLALAEIIDLTIVAVALPDIMGALNANINEISLTITTYIVAAAIFIPLTGFVTAKFGIKQVALASALLFGISSILCGIATSVNEMVVFRLLQGIGGAFLPSLAQAYIAQEFQDDDRNKMTAIFSSCVVLGPIIGPIMGGAITEYMSWRWIFYVNVPICAISFFAIQALMDNSRPHQIKADYTSFMFMAIGFGCLEYFLDEGNTLNWFDSPTLIIVFALAILFIIFFIWRGLLGKSVVDFQIFKYRNYVLSCIAVFIFMIIMVGNLTFFPTLLQQGYGFPVDSAGYIAAPRGVASFIAAPIFMRLAKNIDPRKLMFVGILIFAIASYQLCEFSAVHSNRQIILAVMLQGFGMMGVFINLFQLTYTNMPPELFSAAAGVFNFFRNIGSSIGTSIASTILSQQNQVAWNDQVSHINNFNPNYQRFTHLFHNTNEAILNIISLVKQQAFLVANLDVFYYSMIGVILLVWIPFTLDKPENNNKQMMME